jgi:sugar lactone lactonase YvrE
MRTRARILPIVGTSVGLLLAYLLLWPVEVDPEAWQAPPDLGLGNCPDTLRAQTRLAKDADGPEAIAFDREGRLLTGLADGRVVFVDDKGQLSLVANTGGRPLGIKVAPDGRIFVADAVKGLIAIETNGSVTPLATQQGGKPFLITDDLDLLPDGSVVFTDASWRQTADNWKHALIEHRRQARVLRWRPGAADVELLSDQFYFANGVATAPDGNSVVVCDVADYRLWRVYTDGERRGQRQLLVDNLPGFCDNVTWSPSRRVYWVAIASPRNALVDTMAPWPALRRMTVRLPDFLQPKPQPHAIALAVDDAGKIVRCLQHQRDEADVSTSSVIERDGVLYLGTFEGKGIGRVALGRVALGAAAQP